MTSASFQENTGLNRVLCIHYYNLADLFLGGGRLVGKLERESVHNLPPADPWYDCADISFYSSAKTYTQYMKFWCAGLSLM